MQIPQELQAYGVHHARKPVQRRLVLTTEGGPGVGKTDLFYRTAPRPALAIQIDLNDEGIQERHENDLDIMFAEIVMPPTPTKRTEANMLEDAKIYVRLRDIFLKSVTKNYFRSIMIDEGAQLYELVRRAHLVDLGFGGSKQQSYAPVNSAMKRFYTLAKQKRFNLYIPHRQTDEREEGVNDEGKKTSTLTGRKKAAGWKDALYESQCHLLLEKDPNFDVKLCDACNLPRKGPDKKVPGCTCDKFVKRDPLDKFKATVKKCTANTKVEGTVLTGDSISWATIGQLVFPHSSEEDWQ